MLHPASYLVQHIACHDYIKLLPHIWLCPVKQLPAHLSHDDKP